MKLMVLDKEEKWGIHKAKIYEECLELVGAINKENKIQIIEEVLDIIQVSIGILDKIYHSGIDIQQAVYRHNSKLAKRGLDTKAIIKIQVDKR